MADKYILLICFILLLIDDLIKARNIARTELQLEKYRELIRRKYR